MSSVSKLLKTILRPSRAAFILHDLFKLERSVKEDKEHLAEAFAWLCRAQDAGVTGGVASGYYPPYGGWLEPYPETTGYIIPTLLLYGERTGDSGLVERCVRMGDWEIGIQMESGAVRGGVGVKTYPIVFNAGQVILGWVALFRKTGEQRFLEAAKRAADWLVDIQDPDGKWSMHTHFDVPHTYHSRVAWPVLEIADLTGDRRIHDCGRRNIEWVLSQRRENDWFDCMGFKKDDSPLTHTIAYTIRGLIESSRFLDEESKRKTLDAAGKAAARVMSHYLHHDAFPDGDSSTDMRPPPLPATFDSDWESVDRYSCITGNAQMAINWLRLYQLEGDAGLLDAARMIIDQIKQTQSLTSGDPGIRGAVPGSSPCWGKYNPFSFPNWATKFFADALMLQESVLQSREESGV